VIKILKVETNHKYELEIRHLYNAFFQGEKNIVIKSDICDNKIYTELKDENVHLKDCREYNEKNDLKRAVYDILKSHFEEGLEWGILTGIRPTKIVVDLKLKGKTDEYIISMLEKNYYMSEEKSKLLIEVVNNEEKKVRLNKIDDSINVYINIPFCPSRCYYCSFMSMDYTKYDIDLYVEDLIKEINEITQKKHILSVYIGGGTPSILNEIQLEKLLLTIRKKFLGKYEFTVEAGRVDTLNRKKLEVMKKYNVNRISINPQTMNDSTLEAIGRKHTSKDVIDIYNIAREVGFENINMDIILGLKNEGVEEVKYTLSEISKLNPESITMHVLSVKTNSDLNRNIEEEFLQYKEEIRKMILEVHDLSSALNMNPYYLYRQKNILGGFENIGFAKDGKECVYNIHMIEENTEIIPIGIGATGRKFEKDKIKRIKNSKNMVKYIREV
jgi:oxygen-independent coproporphyrinogen-3 oxidase